MGLFRILPSFPVFEMAGLLVATMKMMKSSPAKVLNRKNAFNFCSVEENKKNTGTIFRAFFFVN